MTDPRLDPLGIRPSDIGEDFLRTIDGVTTWSPFSVPVLTPLTTIVDGYVLIVFDSDGQIVYTEAS